MIAARRGDVVLARLDPTLGVETKKTRPVIVLSNDAINHFAELAVVVPLTKNTSRLSPSHTLVPKGIAGLAFPSKAVTEQIIYALLQSVLGALTKTGIAVCGGPVVQPLAGRTEGIGPRN